MPILQWDNLSDRKYENGIDRGVLYLPDGSAHAWSGLTSVSEKSNKKSTSIYYDGAKINESLSTGDFEASLKCITYPEIFNELDGSDSLRRGVQVGQQKPKFFNLSYRTKVGDAINGPDAAYKIHLIYNLVATPSDKVYSSLSSSPSLVEFEWNISAVPEEIPGHRPTAHFTFDSRYLDPWLLEDIERMLYGDSTHEVALPSLLDMATYASEWHRVRVTDNGDGTYTVDTAREGFITFFENGRFEIDDITATYLDEDTFVIVSSVDLGYDILIKIEDNGDGTWTATTDHDDLIVDLGGGEFEILNANVLLAGPDMYRIADTPRN